MPGVNLIAGMKVLRLSRLLRIFRAARGWPQLQSIVFALLAGVASAGWILVLMGVFNYVYGCIGVILFREIDPFHFGRVGRAFVTLHAYELMNYNLMTFVNIRGCAETPGAYVRVCGGISRVLFTLPHPHTHTQTLARTHTHTTHTHSRASRTPAKSHIRTWPVILMSLDWDGSR